MAPRKTKKSTDTSGSGPVTRSRADPKKEVDVSYYSKVRNHEVRHFRYFDVQVDFVLLSTIRQQ